MKSNKKYRVLLIGLMILISTTACSSMDISSENEVSVFNEEQGMVMRGIIEAKDVSINTKIPGKIEKISIEEGQNVKAGDLLVKISSEEIEAKSEQTKALIKAAEAAYEAASGQVEAANSMLEKAQYGARDQEVAQAEAYYNLMEKTYERVVKLNEKGAVSDQKRDEVNTQLEIAKQTLSMAKEGARSEDISGAQALVAQALSMKQAAQGKVDQAKAGLDEINVYLKETKLTSPIDGVVTVLNADEGELVSTGMSIATVTNLDKMWVEVKVEETQLRNIQIGQIVNVKVPGYSDESFDGKIIRINKKPDFATKRATNDNGNFDIVTFGVKIEIENEDTVLRPGMTAFVQFKN